MFDNNSSQICIRRNAYNAQTFDDTYKPTPVPSLPRRVRTLVKSHCSFDGHCLGRFFLARFPIFRWVYTYRIRKYLFGDIIAGITVAMLHLPQGMAYALLALQHPVYGLYTSMLFSFVYPIFGSSRHTSLGTFAIISLLTSNVIREVATSTTSDSCSNSTNKSTLAFSPQVLEKIGIATTLNFLIGCVLIVFGVLRLGFISNLFSRPFTRAYVAGAGVHVFVAQLDSMFGLTICDVIPSIFKVPYTVYRVIEQIVMLRVNWLSIGISAICIVVIYIVKFLNDFLQKKKFPFPLPIQLFVIIIFTVASYLAKFDANFGVNTVGTIPRGLPSPTLPTPSYFLPLLPNAIIIAMVVYSIGVSMAQVLADKYNYRIDANQELLAYGMCSITASFFFSIPGGVSLSRSFIQSGTGGKTQLASIVAGVVIFLVLAAIAPLFESLPIPVLAAIVIVALHGLYLHVLDLPLYWRVSKYDLFIWIVTFLCTVVINVEIGLACGLAISLLVFVFRTVVVSPVLLGNLPSSEFYVDVKEFDTVAINSSVRIVQLSSPLFFANATKLKNFVIQQLPHSPNSDEELGCGPALHRGVHRIRNRKGHKQLRQIDGEISPETTSTTTTSPIRYTPVSVGQKFRIILDCTCIPFIDSVGGTALCDINSVLSEKGHLFYLAGMSRGVREDLTRARGDQWKNILDCIFPSIQDALSALHSSTPPTTLLNGDVGTPLHPLMIQPGTRESSV